MTVFCCVYVQLNILLLPGPLGFRYSLHLQASNVEIEELACLQDQPFSTLTACLKREDHESLPWSLSQLPYGLRRPLSKCELGSDRPFGITELSPNAHIGILLESCGQ